MSTLDTIVKD